jgi:hypothetical protein
MKTQQAKTSRNSAHCLTTMVVATVLVFGWSASPAWGQEHPEHPTGAAKPKSEVTLEDVAQHVESHVQRESKDGVFKIEDKQAGKQLTLMLDRIHRERLSQVGPDLFFVCADFKSADGKTFDLDFFVQGTSEDSLRVVPDKTSIHKENGIARYIWAFDPKKGIWEQKPTATKTNEGAAMEHP